MTITMNPCGFVYFVAPLTGGVVKIGFTAGTDLYKRLAVLALSSPVPLELLASARGSMRDEYAIQNKFFAQRSHGEWFHPSPELTELIGLVVQTGAIPEEFKSREDVWCMARSGPKRKFQIAGLNA